MEPQLESTSGRLARARTPQDEEEAETFVHLARVGWGTDNAAFRRVFASLFLPEATPEQERWFDDLERWFENGPDDPEVVLIRAAASRVRGWSKDGEVDVRRADAGA